MPRDPAIAEQGTFGRRLDDLAWIDTFMAAVRPYVRVRLSDNVLIKMPSEVHPLNAQGARLLHTALSGTPIADLASVCKAVDDPQRLFQIHTFFCDVRDLLSGALGDGQGRLATDTGRFTGSFATKPILAEVALTYRCNLACRFCYAGCGDTDASPGNPQSEPHRFRWPWRRKPAASDHVMTTDEVRRAIDILADDAEVPSLSFTGGEPTLRPDLPDLIAHASGRGLRVNLITNGLRCAEPRYVARLVEAGLTSAQVSLEGADAETHEALTQRRGTFAKTLAGLANLRAAGLTAHTNTTVSRANAHQLAAIVDLAARLGLPHLSMNFLIPTGSSRLDKHGDLAMRYDEIGPYVLAARDRAHAVGVGFHWYSPTPFCLFNPVAHGLGNKGCAACDGLIHVDPSGAVRPCSSFAGDVGNLLTQGFEAVWRGADARYHRAKRHAPVPCRACPHFALCQGACPLYWAERGTGELRRAGAAAARRRVTRWLGGDRWRKRR